MVPISSSFDALGMLCFVVVSFPEYLHIYKFAFMHTKPLLERVPLRLRRSYFPYIVDRFSERRQTL